MKKLPQRIWLDQDSCWTEKPQGEGYTEYVHESYHAQALFHVLNKGVEQGRKEMLDEVCDWLKENGTHYWWDEEDDDGINDLRKAMEKRL